MERRKYPRFSASKGSFVISRTNPYERCSLVDIGMSGLAFSHEMHSVPVDPSDQLAIMTPDGEIFINGLRCRTVSDIPAGSGISLPEASHARRGVCFETLTHAPVGTDQSVYPQPHHRLDQLNGPAGQRPSAGHTPGIGVRQNRHRPAAIWKAVM